MAALTTPPRIGRFHVEAVLGSGGMGEVYKAFDPTLQRAVAVKTVRPNLEHPGFLDRLLREAQACARLHHPNIVTVHEADQVDGLLFIVMEFLHGDDLSTVLQRGSLAFEQKLRVLLQVLDALDHAHAAGVVHRDVKPSNVRCLPDGSVKLVDFGLAHIVEASPLTQAGDVMGTPHYASPEQLRGEAVDHRTDIYSAGVLGYELVTGRRPFEAASGSLGAVIAKVVSEPPPPMGVLWSTRFPEIERIFARAMAKSAADRFQSAREMRSALEGFLAESTPAIRAVQTDVDRQTLVSDAPTEVQGTIVPPAHSKGRGWWLAGAAAGLVAAVVLAWPAPERSLPGTSVDGAPATAPPSALAPPGSTSAVPATSDTAGTTAPERASRAERTGSAGEASPSAGGTPPPSPASTAAGAAAAAPVVAAAAREPSARELFDAMPTGSGMASTGLRYRLIRKQAAGGGESDVDPTTTTFHSGDRVRFEFDSNVDGYLYVVQQGSSGRWTVLFPGPRINGGRNSVARGERYQVPSDDWFLFDATPGTEQVFVFFSRDPMSHLPGFDRPVVRTETIVASVVDDLRGRIRPRDLVLETDSGRSEGSPAGSATYVVNFAEVGQAVAATIVLTHAP